MNSILYFSSMILHISSLILLLLASTKAELTDITVLCASSPTTHESLLLKRTAGEAPAWLKGALYRAGPGLFEHGDRSVNSVVDGLAKIHGWEFNGGEVKYTSRMIPSYLYNKTMQDDRLALYTAIGDVAPDFTLAEQWELMRICLLYTSPSPRD